MRRENRLSKLRTNMVKAGISAVVIPSTDPHSSEYVHPYWKTREWFSGFSGSAGTLVITLKESGLWTDFRYYIQGNEQLNNSEIKLYKQGTLGVPTIKEFLKEKLTDGDFLGVDGTLFTSKEFEEYNRELNPKGIKINRNFDPTDNIWLDRPDKAMSKTFELETKYCGEDRADKISKVQSIMKEKGADYYVISSLADIAWLLNIRGADVDFTPLIVSYVLVSTTNIILFIDSKKLTNSVKTSLDNNNVIIKDYADIADSLSKIESGSSIYYMPETTNCYLEGVIPEGVNIIKGLDITTDLKAIKNDTEIKNIKLAMEKDGVALVKFFKRFEEQVGKKEFTEFTLAKPLRDARLAMEGCVDESFAPIIGYKSNGALCHYSAVEDTALKIEKDGMLLIDSGGQYKQGTTDITRTISLGNTTEEEILHYTLVLKGHINISTVKFPEGTTGGQLDILARQPLWNRGLNFGHGTGHGVGFFLGVHEGPQNISPKSFKAALKEGMVISNEPGLYIEGKHGIRIENLVLTKFVEDGLNQKFFGFETLTLYPYDLNLIDPSILTTEEVTWINTYHKEVLARLTPFLSIEEISWLKDKTREL